MYICVHVCMYVINYSYIYKYKYIYIDVYICMYVCMYVFIYMTFSNSIINTNKHKAYKQLTLNPNLKNALAFTKKRR